MDILNFISWIKGGRQVTTVDASKTLIPLGLKDNRRDDGYLAGAITVGDLQATLSTPSLQQVLDNNHDLIYANNFQGSNAGTGVTEAGGSNVIAFGPDAASTNVIVTDVNAFGSSAANNNQANNVNAFGYKAAINNIKSEVNAFGYSAAADNIGENINAFGREAGMNNQLNGQTIFSSVSFPVYADAITAQTLITVANGASANSVYLYYDIALKAVSAVFPV
jgi:hypothetical protein